MILPGSVPSPTSLLPPGSQHPPHSPPQVSGIHLPVSCFPDRIFSQVSCQYLQDGNPVHTQPQPCLPFVLNLPNHHLPICVSPPGSARLLWRVPDWCISGRDGEGQPWEERVRGSREEKLLVAQLMPVNYQAGLFKRLRKTRTVACSPDECGDTSSIPNTLH